jgi:hypothetical protein
MPDQTWDCRLCETRNPPYTEVCRDCGKPPELLATDETRVSKAASPTALLGASGRKGTAAIWIGLVVMLGPIAIFFFMATFPALFSTNTIMLWHYLSAFGLVLYVPLGLAIFMFGIHRYRHKK